MKLIDKAAVVAEIERFFNKHSTKEYCDEAGVVLNQLEDFLDTLEVKEVDLEKEINKYISNNFFGSQTIGFYANRTNEEPNDQDIVLCAKHFFKLGVNASNPLTWEDIKIIQNISSEVYAEVAKGKDDFYLIYPTEQSFLEEVLKRFKAQKGE